MPTVPDSPEVSGPRQRKPSMKATTNGDPSVERSRKRSEQVQKKSMAAAPTKKKPPTQAPAKTTTTTVAKAAPAKLVPQRRSAEVHTEAEHMSPIQEGADGSGEDSEDAAVPNTDSEDHSTDTDQDTKESEEAELSAFALYLCPRLNLITS